MTDETQWTVVTYGRCKKSSHRTKSTVTVKDKNRSQKTNRSQTKKRATLPLKKQNKTTVRVITKVPSSVVSDDEGSEDYLDAQRSTESNIKVPSSVVNDYRGSEDSLDAQRSTKTVIMGSAQGLFGQCWQDVMERGLDSPFAGRVMCSESPLRSDPHWNLDKNRAFYGTAMEMNREFLLASDIRYYQTANIQKKITIHEVLWLIDNGYTASVSEENPNFTVFSPPAIAAEIRMIHYEHIRPGSKPYKNAQLRFRGVITAIIAEREALLSKAQAVTPLDLDNVDQKKTGTRLYQSLNGENQSPCFFANAAILPLDVDTTDKKEDDSYLSSSDDDSYLSDSDDNSDASDTEIEQQQNQNEDGLWWMPSSCTIL